MLGTSLAGVAGTTITLLYNALLDGSERGQTIGKQVIGIQVRADESVGPIGIPRGVLRAAVPAVLGIGYVLSPGLALAFTVAGLFDILWPLWDPRKQTWHDKVAGSVVLQVERS